MFYTPQSRPLFAPPIYRKKPLPAAQPPLSPQVEDDEAAAHAGLRQPQPMPTRTQPAAQVQALGQRHDAARPAPGMRDDQLVKRHSVGETQPQFDPTGARIPPDTIQEGANGFRLMKRSTDGTLEERRRHALLSSQEAAEWDRLRHGMEPGQRNVKPQPPSARPAASAPQPPPPPVQAPTQTPPPQGPSQPVSQSQPQAHSQEQAASPSTPAQPSTVYDPKVMAALEQAGAEVAAESRRQQRQARRAKMEESGMNGVAKSLDALQSDVEARHLDLEEMYPEHGPEFEAGMRELAEHARTQHEKIAPENERLQEVAAQTYQQWGHGVSGNWISGAAPAEGDGYSPGAPLSQTHQSILDQEAQKHGVDPKDLRYHMEMQRLQDWSRPSSSLYHKLQQSRAAGNHGPVERTRVLPDGRITVNPALGNDQASFEQAIQNTYASDEAKEAARQMWPAYHDRWLRMAREKLETGLTVPGVENYHQWRERNLPEGKLSHKDAAGNVTGLLTQNEMAQRYMDEMKTRSGWRKLVDNVSSSLVAGGGQIIAAGMGAEAMGRGALESLTGLDLGAQEFSEAAAEKARENRALTQTHELTGTTDGFGSRVISGVAQALPSTVLSMVSGGGPGTAAVLGALQTVGGQYAETYASNIDQGRDHDEAFRRSAPAAAFSGVMSGLLTKAFPGGTTALNSGAVRSTLSSGANRLALKGGITDAIRAYAATTVNGAKVLARGALDEIPQEVLDEGISQLSSAYAEGRDPKAAVKEFIGGLPQLIATAGILGAGGEHIGQSHAEQPQRQQMQGTQPVAPPLPQHKIPEATTQSGNGSGQPPQTMANNRQPPQTYPAPAPAATLQEVGKVLGNIERLKDKAKDGRLSLDEQRELDHNEKVLAHTRVKNLEKEQQVIRSLPKPRELNPHKTQVLADAKAVLARPVPGDPRPAPESSEPPIPDATTGSDSDSGKPPQTPPAPPSGPPPNLQTAQARIHNIMNRKREESYF